MVEYSYDADDRFDAFRDDRRDEMRRERMIMDALRELEMETRRMAPPIREFRDQGIDPVMEVINNPSITMTKAQKDAVNNPKRMMNRSGGLETIKRSNQFRSTGFPLPTKRTRKKTKMDKTMSRCLKEANKKMRLKNGKLRKGKTMRDVMKLAHRLCKKS